MRWKTWTIVFVLFVAICIVTDRLFTRIVLFNNPLASSSRIKHLCEDNSDDIPIFGTSRAHGHYSPEDMGINAFNYGMNGISYDVTDVFLQIELAKPRKTPIIIELQHSDTDTLAEMGKFIPFATDPRFRPLLEKYHAMSWRFYFPAIRYFGYYDTLFRFYLNERIHIEKISRGYGQLVHPSPFDKAKLETFVQERLKMRTGYFPEEDQQRRLVMRIKEHPQRLFFLIVSPYHPSYYAHFENEDKFEAFKKELAVLPNAVVIDWGRHFYPEQYYLDTVHLSGEGTSLFSRQIGEKIRQVLAERQIPAAAVKTAKN